MSWIRDVNVMKKEIKDLAATCGLFCGACTLYVARKRSDVKQLKQMAQEIATSRSRPINVQDLDCEGCLSDVISYFCLECRLRSCAKARGVTHCSLCSDFPCQSIIDFNNDGHPHHGEVLKNIRRQKEIGIEGWITEQEERWRCSQCDCVVDWYSRKCPECGGPLDNFNR
jgi:hypothetical protein